MTACVRHQAVFSRIFNRHRFENNELEWLFRRYILRVSRSSSSSSLSLCWSSSWPSSRCTYLIMIIVIRCSMPQSDKQLPSSSFSLLPLPLSALSRSSSMYSVHQCPTRRQPQTHKPEPFDNSPQPLQSPTYLCLPLTYQDIHLASWEIKSWH